MLQQTKEQYTALVETYGDMIYRYCLIHLKNNAQAADMYQDVFLKLFEKKPAFQDEEHAKAWLLKVCVNLCKNKIRYFIMHPHHKLNEDITSTQHQVFPDILYHIKNLPQNYRICLYLFYYEDYSIKKIAELLHRKEGTIKTWLGRGKAELKVKIVKEREQYEKRF